MEQIKAINIVKPGEITIVKMDMPELHEGEALIKLEYCGICGSDMATLKGDQPFSTYPRVPGHEFSGRIVAIKDKNSKFKEGMLVTAVPYLSCHHCYPCNNGKTNCCENIEVMGVHIDGAFREYVTVPVEALVNGRDLSPKILAAVEPYAIGHHAIKRGQVKAGENVLIQGAGPIGIVAMLSAKLRGAKVAISDMLDERLQLAKAFGADVIINSKNEDLTEAVKKFTNGQGADICVEAVGIPETFLSCIDQVCYGGKIILIGNGKRETTFVHSVLLKKEITVYPSRNSNMEDFQEVIDIFADKKVDIEKLITTMYDFDDAVDAFNALSHNAGSMAKVMIKF